MTHFQQAKLWLIDATGLPRDALHIYVGLAVFLLCAALFRLPLRSWKPLAAVVVLALAGEIWDAFETWNSGRRASLAGNWHDVWNTCFWPAVLSVLARYTRVLKR
jgi:hypothetical protein